MKKIPMFILITLFMLAIVVIPLTSVAASALNTAPRAMFDVSITPEFLSYLLAGLAAILFDWFPGLSTWYGNLSSLKKQQIMALLLGIIVAVIFGLGCAGIVSGECTQKQVAELVKIYLIAIGVNQGLHLLTKPTDRS